MSVTIARLSPDSRSAGSPTRTPMMQVPTAPAIRATSNGSPEVPDPQRDPAPDTDQRDLAERDESEASVEQRDAGGGDREDRARGEDARPVGAEDEADRRSATRRGTRRGRCCAASSSRRRLEALTRLDRCCTLQRSSGHLDRDDLPALQIQDDDRRHHERGRVAERRTSPGTAEASACTNTDHEAADKGPDEGAEPADDDGREHRDDDEGEEHRLEPGLTGRAGGPRCRRAPPRPSRRAARRAALGCRASTARSRSEARARIEVPVALRRR